MKFKLLYRGELKTSPSQRREYVHKIRLIFHEQLKRLLEIPPYSGLKTYINPAKGQPKIARTVGGVEFISIISPALNLLAELDVIVMHPELLGCARGDIDNRMKTLLDCLKRPQDLTEVPDSCKKMKYMYTLLDDDKLVTRLNVNTTHLLDAKNENELQLIITVNFRPFITSITNLPFIL
jgi:hypothetical protein